MTTINQELYEALKEGGASEDAAKRAAASVYDKDQLATKTDVAEMRTAIEARLARLESDIGWIKWSITGGSVSMSCARSWSGSGDPRDAPARPGDPVLLSRSPETGR